VAHLLHRRNLRPCAHAASAKTTLGLQSCRSSTEALALEALRNAASSEHSSIAFRISMIQTTRAWRRRLAQGIGLGSDTGGRAGGNKEFGRTNGTGLDCRGSTQVRNHASPGKSSSCLQSEPAACMTRTSLCSPVASQVPRAAFLVRQVGAKETSTSELVLVPRASAGGANCSAHCLLSQTHVHQSHASRAGSSAGC